MADKELQEFRRMKLSKEFFFNWEMGEDFVTGKKAELGLEE